jgi:hypothetical protein
MTLISLDMRKIEVLRGSQGTIYGREYDGRDINVYTNLLFSIGKQPWVQKRELQSLQGGRIPRGQIICAGFFVSAITRSGRGFNNFIPGIKQKGSVYWQEGPLGGQIITNDW